MLKKDAKRHDTGQVVENDNTGTAGWILIKSGNELGESGGGSN